MPAWCPRPLGTFDLDDYIDYLIAICTFLGKSGAVPVHTLGVCQPAVPLIAAVAIMEATGNPYHPASMTLMGGPIDTRKSPTAVNQLAKERGTEWFRRNCLATVPFPYPGMGRQVYPGLPAAVGLHGHEPRPPRQRPTSTCSGTSSPGTATRPRSTATSMTNTWP